MLTKLLSNKINNVKAKSKSVLKTAEGDEILNLLVR